jgi:hypothetical protein
MNAKIGLKLFDCDAPGLAGALATRRWLRIVIWMRLLWDPLANSDEQRGSVEQRGSKQRGLKQRGSWFDRGIVAPFAKLSPT